MPIVANTNLDQYGAIIDAMNAAQTTNQGVVTLPPGDITCKGPIPAKNNVILRADWPHATSIWFEGFESGFAYDALGPAPTVPETPYPNDRIFAGLAGITLRGDHLSSTSTAGAVRVGYNHRTVDLTKRARLWNFPGDGYLIAGSNWNIKIGEVQIDHCAFRVNGTAGFRKPLDVGEVNDFRATFLSVEGCGLQTINPSTGRWWGFCGGINVQTDDNHQCRGWVWDQCEAEQNFGIVEWYMKNMQDQVFVAPYMENVLGGNVGMECDDVTGKFTVPCFNAQGAPVPNNTGKNVSDKCLKFYGNSLVTIENMRRGSGWVTSDIEAYGNSRIALVNCDSALRAIEYDSAKIRPTPLFT